MRGVSRQVAHARHGERVHHYGVAEVEPRGGRHAGGELGVARGGLRLARLPSSRVIENKPSTEIRARLQGEWGRRVIENKPLTEIRA